MDLSNIVRQFYTPNKVNIVGICGQAGAGKTNHITPLLMQAAKKNNIFSDILGLDSFFILSSRERKAWLNEPSLSKEEKERRQNQINWWDFSKAELTLETITGGQTIHLTGIYNRSDGGELTGELRIDPPEEGMLLFFDGVAIVQLKKLLKSILYVHTPSETRFNRLFPRDNGRRSKKDEAEKRFELTQKFEQSYFPEYWKNIDLFIDNSRNNGNGIRIIESINYNDALFG